MRWLRLFRRRSARSAGKNVRRIVLELLEQRTLPSTCATSAFSDGYVWDSHDTGNFDTLYTGVQQLQSQLYPPVNKIGEERILLQFNISSIPSGSVIDSATLSAVPTLLGGNSVTAGFYGFAGDGTLRTSEATASTDLVGTLSNQTDLSPFSVGIDPVFIQGLLGVANYAGFTEELSNPSQLFIWSVWNTLGYPAALLTINYHPASGQPPSAQNDSYTGTENQVLNVAAPGVLANDTDPQGNPLTAAVLNGPANGTLNLGSDGSFAYTPNANFYGTDSFTYRAYDGQQFSAPATVTLTVNQVYYPPTAVDDSYYVAHDASTTVAAPGVLANDIDPNGLPLQATLVNGPTHGSVTLNADGSFVFTPAAGYKGPDSFTYQASDSQLTGSTATVHLFVDKPPVVVNEDILIHQNTPVFVSIPGVLANATDPEGDPLTAVLASGPSHGSLVLNADGSYTYTPVASFSGADYFNYEASDGTLLSNPATVEIDVLPGPVALNDSYTLNENQTLSVSASAGVLVNDYDQDGDSLTAGLWSDVSKGRLVLQPNGAFTYTPFPGFAGTDSFSYVASDGSLNSNVATVTLTVIPSATSLTLTGLPSTSTAGVIQNVQITAYDAFGNVATGYTGTVHFTSSDFQAGLPNDYTFTSADAGVHTFNLILATVGNQSVTATDTSNSGLTASSTVAMSPAAASRFVASVTRSTAGSPFTLALAALDPYGNHATGYLGTVHFTSSDVQAGLPADYTFTAGDAGSHTFSVTLKTAGSQSVTVTDTVTATITGGATVTVNPAAATHVTLTAPATCRAGTAFSMTVTARDAFNNRATGYRGTVHFTSSDATAVLPANYTFLATDSGVRTFTNGVTLKSAGSQTVTATDTVTATIAGSATVSVNPSHFSISGPGSTTAGVVFSITVTALDANNHVAVGYLGTVHFTSSDGQAVLPANYTFVSGDAGVHTFTVTLKTAGSRTVTARDTGTSTIVGSVTVSVIAGAAKRLRLTAPSTSTAGAPFTLAVTALDTFGNKATGYRGTVHFTSSDTMGTLPADYTFLAGDAGIHTFTGGVTLNTAGSQMVTATDTVTGTITGRATVTVNPGPATHVALTAPASSISGTAFTITLTALDAFGNTASGYRGTVHFTSSDATAVLPANYRFVAGDAGVHTFTNGVTLKSAGSQIVTARDIVTGSISGNGAVNVSPSHFSISGPSSTTVGAAFSITVTALDANNNVATGYLGTVHFTSSDSLAGLPIDYTFIAGDAGVHTFANGVTMNTTGNQTITATDTVSASITGSTTITVNSGPMVRSLEGLSPSSRQVSLSQLIVGTGSEVARAATQTATGLPYWLLLGGTRRYHVVDDLFHNDRSVFGHTFPNYDVQELAQAVCGPRAAILTPPIPQ